MAHVQHHTDNQTRSPTLSHGLSADCTACIGGAYANKPGHWRCICKQTRTHQQFWTTVISRMSASHAYGTRIQNRSSLEYKQTSRIGQHKHAHQRQCQPSTDQVGSGFMHIHTPHTHTLHHYTGALAMKSMLPAHSRAPRIALSG
jgi:hypothetical protein